MRRPWVVLALNLAPLAGCGGDDGGGERAVTLRPGQGLQVAAREYSFDPARVVVSEPGELRITVRNDGRLPHDLRVMGPDEDLGGTPIFEEGSRTARVPLKRGRYEFVCTVDDHKQLGMTGTLDVR